MRKNIGSSFATALQNIRLRFFHTLLSILGIVIGVAALVAILSLIDGMEQYAREQITKTTSLKAILMQSNQYKVVNEVRIAKTNVNFLTYPSFDSLRTSLTQPAQGYLYFWQADELTLSGNHRPVGAVLIGTTLPLHRDVSITHGKAFSLDDVKQRRAVAFVNKRLARQLAGNRPITSVIGQVIQGRQLRLTIIGIGTDESDKRGEAFVPITLFSDSTLRTSPPLGMIEAENIETVPVLKSEIENWLTAHMPNKLADFMIITNEQRVSQITKGFLLFRIVMGLIVGISVLVGGIGVMNVLLISVTERTVEIGVRKAMGAKKRDILWQFLSESITISTFGSLLGLAIGILSTMAFMPIVHAFIDVPFQVVYTWNTFIVIMVIAMLIGVIFGTYPAMRAARLDPVEAIRRE